MMKRAPLLSKWYNMPVPVRQFLSRALMLLVIWKALYLLVLEPKRILDRPLTNALGRQSAWILNKVMPAEHFVSRDQLQNVPTENGLVLMHLQNVYMGRRMVVSIEDPCNGLELMILYAGFIICLPALLRDKLIYIIAGIILIHIVNVIRCSGVGYVILNYPAHANFTHHYVFTFIVYGFIMLLWYFFSNRIVLKVAHE
jgi:exosortase family protein XrtF